MSRSEVDFTSFLTILLWGKDRRRRSFILSRWLFLRLLGLIFLIAFVSFWWQIDGLIGSKGLLPATEYLRFIRQNVEHCYWEYPTLCWIGSSDTLLAFLCGTGVLLSLLLIVGIAPLPVLFLLWLIYLSLVVVGQTFFSFQWDVLLLETSFLALFLAPLTLLPSIRGGGDPWRPGFWLQHGLLFKLMFLSGVTKLLSGDTTWFRLTALPVHYETQPLPTVVGWYAYQFPGWFHDTSVVVMFVIEMLVPFLIFTPRRPRHLGCAALMLFQVTIALTGNYTFFNLLTFTLCVPLLDDEILIRLVPARWRQRFERRFVRKSEWKLGTFPERQRRWRRVLLVPVALLFFLSGLSFLHEIVRTYRSTLRGRPVVQFPRIVAGPLEAADRFMLRPLDGVREWVRPLRTINGYGLFRNMTVTRPEIVIEGSHDGVHWKEYGFHWKPGATDRAPGWVAPHQPRLDWQMWFAALNYRGHRYWLNRLVLRLFEGSPEVLALLDENPFPDEPPHHIRLMLYIYHFTNSQAKRETGAWWRRELVRRLGSFTSPAELRR